MHKLHSYNFTYGDSDTSTNLATSGFSLISSHPLLCPYHRAHYADICVHMATKSTMLGKKFFYSYFNFLIKWLLSHTAGIRGARTSIWELGLFRLALSTSSVIRCWSADVRQVNQGLDQRNPLLHWQKFTWPLQFISILTPMSNGCTATLQEFWFPFHFRVKGRKLVETVFAGQT